MMTRADGTSWLNCAAVVRPSPSGMVMSSSTTSGTNERARESACLPLAASPATVMSGSRLSVYATPWRNSG